MKSALRKEGKRSTEPYREENMQTYAEEREGSSAAGLASDPIPLVSLFQPTPILEKTRLGTMAMRAL